MVVPKTLANFLERIAQLYEQGADVKRIGRYFRNWWRSVRAGVEISFLSAFTVSHSQRHPLGHAPIRTDDFH